MTAKSGLRPNIEVGLTAGQAGLVAALIESFHLKGNPLRSLWEDVYPRWFAADRPPVPPPSPRRYYGEEIPDALSTPSTHDENLQEQRQAIFNEWASHSGFITSDGEIATWITDWAVNEFPLGPKWPTVRNLSPWWHRLDSFDSHRLVHDELSSPGPIPIEVNVTIPNGATESQAIKLFLAKFREARDPTTIISKGAGQSGHPITGNNARYLARALCGLNRNQIAKRFNVTENAVTKGQKRAADAAGIQFPLNRTK